VANALKIKTRMVKGEDLQTLGKKLQALGKAARRTKRRALGQASKELYKGMRVESPVKTGAMKKSIGTVRAKNDIYYTGVRGAFVDKKTQKQPAKYAAYVERRRPWAEPFWKANIDKIEDIMIRAFRDQILKEQTRLAAAK
jgi:hypothetical protein